MATIDITSTALTVRPSPLHVLLSLTRQVVVPLTAVRGATADPGAISEPTGIRASGTHVPGVVIAGRFRRGGDRVFYDVRRRDRIVVVELEPGKGQPWRRLVIEVPDPGAVVEAVERAIANRPGPPPSSRPTPP